jgi:hypothetical protein
MPAAAACLFLALLAVSPQELAYEKSQKYKEGAIVRSALGHRSIVAARLLVLHLFYVAQPSHKCVTLMGSRLRSTVEEER